MQRILSGIRPTGDIHLGNYLGSLKQWVELSDEPETECFFMIADYHALMSFRDTPLDQATYDLLAWQIAAGLDPRKVVLFVQSRISAHTELAWIFNALVTVPELGRMTQYKDLVNQGTEQPSAALLTYPVLQAADILLYKANLVPVGKDQVQHIELTRTIAQRLNRIAKNNILPETKPRLTDSASIASLHDPAKKMSKSLPQGALLLGDDEATLRAKIGRAVTDTGTNQKLPDEIPSSGLLTPEQKTLLYAHMSPGVRNLFVILQETTNASDDFNRLVTDYCNQTLRYSDLKAVVADAVVEFVLPLQQRYRDIREDMTNLEQILIEGTTKASVTAKATLQEIKHIFNLTG